jgi:hypothetical protein
VILEKSCSKTSQQKDHDMAAKRNNTWQQKCRHLKMHYIYILKTNIKIKVKTNRLLNYEIFVLISLLNFQVEIDPKYSNQEDKILSLSYPR